MIRAISMEFQEWLPRKSGPKSGAEHERTKIKKDSFKKFFSKLIAPKNNVPLLCLNPGICCVFSAYYIFSKTYLKTINSSIFMFCLILNYF